MLCKPQRQGEWIQDSFGGVLDSESKKNPPKRVLKATNNQPNNQLTDERNYPVQTDPKSELA